jgi:hypothetical protein
MSNANQSILGYVEENVLGGGYNEFYAVLDSMANSLLSASANPANNDTVTLNSRVYTFKTTLTGAADEIKIGATLLDTLQNLISAINAWSGSGTKYGVGTVINALVSANLGTNKTSVVFTAKEHTTVLTGSEASTALTFTLTKAGPTTVNGSSYAKIHFNGESLVHGKETVATEEIRQDRSVGDLIEVGVGASGSIETEFHIEEYTSFIEGVLFGVPVTVTNEALATAAISADGILTTGTSMSAALQGARLVRIAGYTAGAAVHNGIKRIRPISATSFQILNHAGGTAGAASITVSASYVRNGITPKSFTLYKEMITPKQVITLHGMVPNSWSLTAEARKKIMQSFEWMGYAGRSWPENPFDGYVGPVVAPVVTSSNNIASIQADRIALPSPVQNFRLTVANNLRGRYVIGDKGTLEPGSGNCDITGSLDCYFSDRATFEAYLNHEEKSLEMPITDSDGRTMNIFLPKIRFTGDTPKISGVNTDIIQNFGYRAVQGAGGYQIQIDTLV